MKSKSIEAQKQRVLAYIKANGSITPKEAYEKLGVYRLSACIFILREEGRNIKTQIIDVPNRYGQNCRVARYFISRGRPRKNRSFVK